MKEFAWHKAIAKQLKIKGCFAHFYHSWERGVNKNTNALLRRYFLKGVNSRHVRQKEIDAAVFKHNNKSRKALGFTTPAEMIR